MTAKQDSALLLICGAAIELNKSVLALVRGVGGEDLGRHLRVVMPYPDGTEVRQLPSRAKIPVERKREQRVAGLVHRLGEGRLVADRVDADAPLPEVPDGGIHRRGVAPPRGEDRLGGPREEQHPSVVLDDVAL